MVFGELLSGHEMFKKIEGFKTGPNDKPAQPILIADCGVLTEGESKGEL